MTSAPLDLEQLQSRLIGIATALGLEWPPEYRQQVFDTTKEAAAELSRLEAENKTLTEALEKYAQDKTCRGDLARIALRLPVIPEGGHAPATHAALERIAAMTDEIEAPPNSQNQCREINHIAREALSLSQPKDGK